MCRPSFAKSVPDRIQNGFLFRHHVGIPEAQNLVTARLKPECPRVVMFNFVWLSMLGAVELDDEFGGRTKDIGKVWSDGVLPAKSPTAKSLATQECPEPAFSVRGAVLGHDRALKRPRMFSA